MIKRLSTLAAFAAFALAPLTSMASSAPQVIAHRGASGYTAEHSMAAKRLAIKMGADYLEQDLVMTRDNQLIVLHDLYLEAVTDVAKRFPGRARADGHYYAIDFDWQEISQLEMTPRYRIRGAQKTPAFPERAANWSGQHRIHTFEQELQLVAEHNATSAEPIGIYPEIKAPGFHRHEGRDISVAVLQMLAKYGYRDSSDKVFLQSFEAPELERIYDKLLPQMELSIPLVQLIAQTRWQMTRVYKEGQVSNYDYDWMLAPGGMEKISRYAAGIGPWINMLVSGASPSERKLTDLVTRAHQHKLLVHPYTLRTDSGRLPGYASSFEDLLALLFDELKVDGAFIDQPDKLVEWLEQR